MRRSILAAAAVGMPLLVGLFLIGCGRPVDEADVGGDTGGGSTAGPAKPAEMTALPAKHGAVLRGKVTIQARPMSRPRIRH